MTYSPTIAAAEAALIELCQGSPVPLARIERRLPALPCGVSIHRGSPYWIWVENCAATGVYLPFDRWQEAAQERVEIQERIRRQVHLENLAKMRQKRAKLRQEQRPELPKLAPKPSNPNMARVPNAESKKSQDYPLSQPQPVFTPGKFRGIGQ